LGRQLLPPEPKKPSLHADAHELVTPPSEVKWVFVTAVQAVQDPGGGPLMTAEGNPAQPCINSPTWQVGQTATAHEVDVKYPGLV
jgi:hypothetical protein